LCISFEVHSTASTLHSMETIQVVIADSQPLFRLGIASLLSRSEDTSVLWQTGSEQDFLDNLSLYTLPDVAIIDCEMALDNNLKILDHLHRYCPSVSTILLAHHYDKHMGRAIELGMKGCFMRKNLLEELTNAVRVVALGGYHLSKETLISLSASNSTVALPAPSTLPVDIHAFSRREQEIIVALANSDHDKQVASRLGISNSTLNNHKANIQKKANLPPGRNYLRKWALQQYVVFLQPKF
jgi:two-component system, NarL family, response regulator DegU